MAAKLYITIYEHVSRDMVNTPIPIPQTPPLAEDFIEIEMTSKQSLPFDDRARFIAVISEVPCCLAFGDDPEAKVGFHPMNAGDLRWYGVRPGQHLAVIEYT